MLAENGNCADQAGLNQSHDLSTSGEMKAKIPARPCDYDFDTDRTAVLAIDLQKDFLECDGFGAEEGGSAFNRDAIDQVLRSIEDTFKAARSGGIEIIHTRVGHAQDLSDLPFHKTERQRKVPGSVTRKVIGDEGLKGRMLIRGQPNQDLVDALASQPGELVIDKTGTGAFYNTGLDAYLSDRQITHLILVGCTTECCVTSTLREANDRGYECCILSDCVTGFLPTDQNKACLDLVSFSNGLFGYVSPSKDDFVQLVSRVASRGISPSSLNADLLGDITALGTAYRQSRLDPLQVVAFSYERIRARHNADTSVFIRILDWSEVSASVSRLLAKYPDRDRIPPLFGIPYVVKDNIDIVGIPTTAACPTLNYVPVETATCVKRLEAAGAILLGKTNMDQFATGLVGMRSPYGNPGSAYSGIHIAGGSSSGSAVAIGERLATFALGTDTAASVRVPAAFNGIVGLKPTRGSSSIHGIIPASPSLDCVGVFTQDVKSAWAVWMAIRGYDPLDLYSDTQADGPRLPIRFAGRFTGRAQSGRSFTFVTPSNQALQSMCPQYRPLFEDAIRTMEDLGGRRLLNFDWSPFELAQKELYGSARMAERAACLHDFFQRNGLDFSPDQMHPITRQSVKDLQPRYSASAAFEVMAALRKLSHEARKAWRVDASGKAFDAPVDVILTPTVPFHPTKEAVEKEPLTLNGDLGIYSQAVNLLDMCAVSLPLAQVEDSNFTSGQAPFGVQLIADKWEDGFVLSIAERLMNIASYASREGFGLGQKASREAEHFL